MTTLPQTTPLRLPRPNQTTAMLPAGAPVGAMAPNSGFQLTPADIWRIMRANFILILALLVIAAVAGYLINEYLAKHHSRFTATGLIQVQAITSNNPLAPNERVNNAELYNDLRTQVQLLRQESLFSRVLQNEKSEIRKTIWFKQFPAGSNVSMAKQDLAENFGVSMVPETRLVAVSMTYSVPSDCKIIVQEIVDQHLQDQRTNIQNKQINRRSDLEKLKNRYMTSLRDVTEDLRIKMASLSASGGMSQHRSNFKETELYELIKGRNPIQMNVAAAKAALEKGLGELSRGEDPAQVVDAVDRMDEVVQLRQEIRSMETVLVDLSDQFGVEHPIVSKTSKRLDVSRGRFATLRAEKLAETRARYIDELRRQVDDSQKNLDALQQRMDVIRAEIGDVSNVYATYMSLKDEEAALRALVKQINEQLDIIQNDQNKEMSNVAWMNPDPANRLITPDRPTFPNRWNTISTSLVMALALGLGIAFLRELMDTTVRSPRDITRVGQLNLLGMVPHEDDDPQSAGARLPLVIFDAPHSIIAEQFRHIRTRLQHAASLDTTRSIMVTAPSPKDGKTTVACNLAAGLALNGRKILLVDADFRRPEIHRIFGFQNEVGFSGVLSGQTQFKEAVQESQVPNLSIMTSGPKPPNATELFESQLYNDFIERASEEFDHVIFDTGPFLVVSESFAMAPRVDGVVTVVRAHKDSRGILARMRDTLRQVKAEHLGIVLNGVRAHGGGYYGRNIKTYYAYERGQG